LAAEGGLEKLDEMVSHLGRLAALNHAVEELEQALQRNETAESFYQGWCQRNSWAFGMNYLDADAIRKITREDQVDLLMPRLFGGYRDLVELKTPTVKVLDKLRDFLPSFEGCIGSSRTSAALRIRFAASCSNIYWLTGCTTNSRTSP
jgi:hypothetical protein